MPFAFVLCGRMYCFCAFFVFSEFHRNGAVHFGQQTFRLSAYITYLLIPPGSEASVRRNDNTNDLSYHHGFRKAKDVMI